MDYSTVTVYKKNENEGTEDVYASYSPAIRKKEAVISNGKKKQEKQEKHSNKMSLDAFLRYKRSSPTCNAVPVAPPFSCEGHTDPTFAQAAASVETPVVHVAPPSPSEGPTSEDECREALNKLRNKTPEVLQRVISEYAGSAAISTPPGANADVYVLHFKKGRPSGFSVNSMFCNIVQNFAPVPYHILFGASYIPGMSYHGFPNGVNSDAIQNLCSWLVNGHLCAAYKAQCTKYYGL